MDSESLDNIWDEPIENTVSSRQTTPLFLADSGDEEPPRPPPPAIPEVDVDIDAMFADVENADDPFTFKPLAPSLDTEALRREAEARHKNSVSSSISHVINKNAPLGGQDDGGSQKTSAKTDNAKEEKKERKQPMRLDEGRLLGPTGFPKLIKYTENLKIKGKGHELSDLNRLLQVYGYWTHEMYPKTTFRDTVERVEKLCHSKRMHVALSVWRDEGRGSPNGRKSEDGVIDLDEEVTAVNARGPRSSSLVSDGVPNVSSLSRPPSSGPELDDEDDFDIDAIMQEEERLIKERAISRTLDSAVSGVGNPKGKSQKAASNEDSAMWEALDALQEDASLSLRVQEDRPTGADATATAPTRPVSVEPVSRRITEDEEMWDIVHEMEKESIMAPTPVAAPKPVIETVAVPAIAQEEDDDWDSVYV